MIINGQKAKYGVAIIYKKEIEEFNYKMGREFGSQKVWYLDGKIKSNYIIKNNRRYGLLGTKNCTNVSEEVFDM